MLNGYKTYLAAAAAVLIAAGVTINAYVNGEPLKVEILISAIIALAILFLRKGIKENGGKKNGL
jgi:hypothetical protein